MGKISGGLMWKLMESFGISGIQFVLQIFLARLLDPSHYGALSIMVIFTSLANVFVQNGFSTALVQNKNTQEEDYSSVLWMQLLIALGMYALIFVFAPLIARAYKMDEIVLPLRVLALMLFPGAVNAVQIAKVKREMNFKKLFVSNVGSVAVSGVAGVLIAFMGGGLWALVAQSFLHVAIACVVMNYTARIRFVFKVNLIRIKELFAFGWRLLCSGLIDTLYQDLRSLVIGYKYTSDTLGYYNRGKHFPQVIINAVNSAVISVMLPAMSREQDDAKKVKTLMRSSVSASAYILFPMMAGLAAVGETLVSVLLTEKWLPCVPYMQIYCFTLAFYPVHSCNLQAINAMGRSDIFLKLEILKKVIGIIILTLAVVLFDTPIAIAMTGVISTFTSCIINAYPNKKLIDYPYLEQIKDMLPAFAISIMMGAAVLAMGAINLPKTVLMVLQIVIGIGIYLLLSEIVKPEAYKMLKTRMKTILKKKFQRNA